MMKRDILIILFLLNCYSTCFGENVLKQLMASCDSLGPLTITYESDVTASVSLSNLNISILTRIVKISKNIDILRYIEFEEAWPAGQNIEWNKIPFDSPFLKVKQISEKKYAIYPEKIYNLISSKLNYEKEYSRNIEKPHKGLTYLYNCFEEFNEIKDKQHVFSAALDPTLNEYFLLEFYKYKDGKLKVTANFKNKIIKLPNEFSNSTRIYRPRFIKKQGSYFGLFKTIDSKWMVSYCWDIYKKEIYYKAIKINSKKVYYSPNCEINNDCTCFFE